jgi:hypothetical protein
MQDRDGDAMQWSKGGGNVCLSKTGTGDYSLDVGNNGLVESQTGEAVSIYVDGNLTINGNKGGISGGIYAEGDVTTTGNKVDLFGDKSTMGGLALWAEGNIDIKKNSVEIKGIIGANGDAEIGGTGGGTGPEIDGIISVGQDLTLPSNSNNHYINHDPSQFNESFLSNTDWTASNYGQIDEKNLYANAEVFLVN